MRFRKTSTLLIVVACAIAAIGIGLWQRDTMWRLAIAVQQRLMSVSRTPSFDDREALLVKNEALSAQIADLSFRIAQLQGFEGENAQLRDLLGVHPMPSVGRVTAPIIGSDPYVPDSIIIAGGTEEGIASGDPVVAREGHLIGVVASVKSHTSSLIFITDNVVRISVARAGERKPIGVSRGSYGLGILVDYIPRNEVVEIGDVLVTGGLDSRIPAGLVIGMVNRETSSDNDLFKQVAVVPGIDYKQLSIVTVLTRAYEANQP